MIELQQNRYLWVQLVGLAAVPLLLDICLAGLAATAPAAGYPSAYGLQFWAIAAVGILPALAMQWLRPFYLFSLPPLALNPATLTADQRRCLNLLKSWQIKAIAVVSAALELWVLSQLYAHTAQVALLMTPIVGLVSAVVTFFLACTFFQISLSSVRLILVDSQTLRRVTPYEPAAIAANFSILGLRVDKILRSPVAVAPDVSENSPTATDSQNLKRDSNADVSELLTADEPLVASELPKIGLHKTQASKTESSETEFLKTEPREDALNDLVEAQITEESSASEPESRSVDLSEE